MVKKTKKNNKEETVENLNKTDENIHQEEATETADASADAGQYEELRKKLLKEYEAQKGGDDQVEETKEPENEAHEEPTIIEEPVIDEVASNEDEPEVEEDMPAYNHDEHSEMDDDEDEQEVEEDTASYEDDDMLTNDHNEHSEMDDDDEEEGIPVNHHEDEEHNEQEIEEDAESDEYEDMPNDGKHTPELNEGEESLEYSSDNLEDDMSDVYNNTAPDVDQGQSSVAINSKKSLAMMVILALVVVFILYKVLKSEDTVDSESQIDKNSPITVPVADTGQAIVVPDIPDIPAVPKLSAPTPPPAPTPPMVSDLTASQPTVAPITAPAPTIIKKESPEDIARRKARLSSGIMVGSNTGAGQNTNVTKDGKSLSILARNNDQVVATNIGDLRRVIAQGKVIDAVLETAINTDLPGSVRAIISRDIYSESGKNILIPRGSRLLGSYSSTVSFGINRVKVSWSRLIRPDGVDIAIASPGIDQIGHAGVAGDLDNHIAKSMSIAVMTSVIDIAAAIYADKQAEPNITTSTVQPSTGNVETTNDDGTTSVTQAASTGSTVNTGIITNEQQAYMDAVDNIGSVGKNLLEKSNAMKPTITIDQGAAVKVFVNKDLVFPGKSANLTRIVE